MTTYVFIDASNLFYGGEKSLGWKIDYQKLLKYLEDKYGVSKAFYFGGAEIHNFKYNYLKEETIPIEKLEKYLDKLIQKENLEAKQHIKRIKFYAKLKKFGYRLLLKPVKLYSQENEKTIKKANCDVEMAFYLMKEKDSFDRAIILSGDGDFLPVLKYLKEEEKEIIILSRSSRTAKEIKQFAGGKFRDFSRLKKYIQFK